MIVRCGCNVVDAAADVLVDDFNLDDYESVLANTESK